jgi:hypothetical protein
MSAKLLFLNSEIPRKRELEYKAEERAKGGERELYSHSDQAAAATCQRLGDFHTADIHSSQFWRLEVLDQGISTVA